MQWQPRRIKHLEDKNGGAAVRWVRVPARVCVGSWRGVGLEGDPGPDQRGSAHSVAVLRPCGGFAGRTAASGPGAGGMLSSGHHCCWEKGDCSPASARVQGGSSPRSDRSAASGGGALCSFSFLLDTDRVAQAAGRGQLCLTLVAAKCRCRTGSPSKCTWLH